MKQLWDTRDGTFVRSLTAHTSEVTGLCYTNDELYLVSASADLSILIWDLTINVVTKRLLGHTDVING
jgi:WD40 repeat protein